MQIIYLDTDYEDDGLETLKRYKPRSLDELASRTKFSKKEIQLIYQGFKQECPSGKIFFVRFSFFINKSLSRYC
jgi:hypothetical protein